MPEKLQQDCHKQSLFQSRNGDKILLAFLVGNLAEAVYPIEVVA